MATASNKQTKKSEVPDDVRELHDKLVDIINEQTDI